MSAPLQTAVFGALSSNAELAALVDDHIYDAVPGGVLPPTYVRFGRETARDASDGSGAGALHRFTISVITTVPGFACAKEASGVISDILHNADLTLSRGRLVTMRFERAKAARTDAGATRQIDLQFRARVQDD
jgi:hypothetical protein